tara:strand:- start:348 stop:605 length:258 start_codon:yes stop_codon:yes gene_type:complete
MVKSNTYRVEVSEDTDFFEGWTDASIPNMTFMYDQESIAECEDIDGVYFATYQTWVIDAPHFMEWATPTGTDSTTIPVGEYGIKP